MVSIDAKLNYIYDNDETSTDAFLVAFATLLTLFISSLIFQYSHHSNVSISSDFDSQNSQWPVIQSILHKILAYKLFLPWTIWKDRFIPSPHHWSFEVCHLINNEFGSFLRRIPFEYFYDSSHTIFDEFIVFQFLRLQQFLHSYNFIRSITHLDIQLVLARVYYSSDFMARLYLRLRILYTNLYDTRLERELVRDVKHFIYIDIFSQFSIIMARKAAVKKTSKTKRKSTGRPRGRPRKHPLPPSETVITPSDLDEKIVDDDDGYVPVLSRKQMRKSKKMHAELAKVQQEIEAAKLAHEKEVQELQAFKAKFDLQIKTHEKELADKSHISISSTRSSESSLSSIKSMILDSDSSSNRPSAKKHKTKASPTDIPLPPSRPTSPTSQTSVRIGHNIDNEKVKVTITGIDTTNLKNAQENPASSSNKENISDDVTVPVDHSPPQARKITPATATVTPPLPVFRCQHLIYCRAKIRVPKSDKPSIKLRNSVMSFMTTLLKADKSLQVIEYHDSSHMKYITKPMSLPETLTGIRSFFDGKYRPSANQQDIWTQVKIGINVKESSDFFEDCKAFFGDTKMHFIQPKDIQAADTEVIGYFLYSHHMQDKGRLGKSLAKQMKRIYHIDDPIALKWQKIASPGGARSPKDIDPKYNIKALHVEVKSGTGAMISRALGGIYSKSLGLYENNEKMRFLPVTKYLQNTHTTNVYRDIMNRQSWYLELTTHATTWEILDLDTVPRGMRLSLRNIIMNYKTKQGQQLFNHVDFSTWDKSSVKFVYPKAYDEEARSRIADLGSWVCFNHGEDALKKMFTATATLRALESPWDVAADRAINPNAREAEQFLEEAEDIDWLQDPNINKSAALVNLVPPAHTSLLVHLPNDDASLDSFGHRQVIDTEVTNDPNPTAVDPAILPNPNNIKIRSKNTNSDDITYESNSRLDDRITYLEGQINTINESIGNQFDTLFQHLNKLNPNPTTVFTATARGRTAGGVSVALETQPDTESSRRTPDPREGEGAGP